MILLVSAMRGAESCAAALREALNETVVLVASARAAVAALRQHSFSALVVEQGLLEADAGAVDALLLHAPMAVPVFVNLGIENADRVVREVRAALTRSRREQLDAFRAAVASLRSQLKDDATGILLSSQLALATPALPPAAQARLKSVCTLAERLCGRLAG